MLNLEPPTVVLNSDVVRLVEAVPGFGWAATPQGQMIYLGGSFQELIYTRISEVEHVVWSHVIGETERQRVSADWHEAVSKTLPFQATHRLRTRDGPRWMRSAARAQLDESGRQVFWLGTSIDVEATMRIGKPSHGDSTWMKALIDTVPAPIWSANPSGEPTYINRALATQTGIAIDDLEDGNSSVLAAAIASAIHPDDMEMVGAALGRSFSTGEPFRLKYRQRRADGSFGWIRGEAEALRDADGAVLQWYGVCYDIDNEVKAEESLRSAHEALTKAAQFAAMAELSASIGHDVSQPLASTVASADACLRWLASTPPNYQRALRSAQNAFRDANAASEILTRIRALFQRTPPQRKAEDINRIVPQACELLASEMSRSGVKVVQVLGADVPLVLVDAVQIQQVLVNLIRNAAEAMSDSQGHAKQVLVRTRLDGPQLVVEVEDTGPGVSDAEKIFEPYVTTKTTGMGMGLSIARSMILSHGGRLWVENMADGARFAFALVVKGAEPCSGGQSLGAET